MALLSRKTTVLFSKERLDSTAVALSSADLIPIREGPSFTPEFEAFDRPQARTTLTKPASAEGLKSGSVEFAIDLMGPASGDAADDGPYAEPLLCSGMMRWETKRVVISGAGLSGGSVIPSGTRYTSAGSSGGGVCIGDIVDGDPFCFLLPDTGETIATSETFTFGAVSFTSTAGAVLDAKSFMPQTDPLSSISIGSISGGTIGDGVRIEQDQGSGVVARGVTQMKETLGASGGTLYFVWDDASASFDDSATIDLPDFPAVSLTVSSSRQQESEGNASASVAVNIDGVQATLKGWRGNPSIRLKNGEVGVVEFAGQGAGASQPTDVASAGVAADGATPPPVIGGTYAIGASWSPCYGESVWTLGNEVALRECPNDASGYHGSIISNRQPTVTIDPELVKEAIFPILGNLWDKTTFRIAFSLGSGTPGGNNFVLNAKSAQMQSASPGDRNGIATVDATANLSGVADDELALHAF